jgi:uncharacterized membrane protein
MLPKSKKYIIVPQKLFLYQQQDKELQEKQNDLILWNTRVAIVVGMLAVFFQLLEVIVSWFK